MAKKKNKTVSALYFLSSYADYNYRLSDRGAGTANASLRMKKVRRAHNLENTKRGLNKLQC
jgi:hypothetical protein